MKDINVFKNFAVAFKGIRRSNARGSSGTSARNRLNRSILADNLDIPEEVLDLMKGEVFFAVNKYLDADEDRFEMKWSREKDADGRGQFIEFVARVPVDGAYVKKALYQ